MHVYLQILSYFKFWTRYFCQQQKFAHYTAIKNNQQWLFLYTTYCILLIMMLRRIATVVNLTRPFLCDIAVNDNGIAEVYSSSHNYSIVKIHHLIYRLPFCTVQPIHCKKGWRFPRPLPGCHLPNSPWPGIIKLFSPRESLVSGIPFGDGETANFFFTDRPERF